jgi:hypothetical protein
VFVRSLPKTLSDRDARRRRFAFSCARFTCQAGNSAIAAKTTPPPSMSENAIDPPTE